jgi:hypothetical protein
VLTNSPRTVQIALREATSLSEASRSGGDFDTEKHHG